MVCSKILAAQILRGACYSPLQTEQQLHSDAVVHLPVPCCKLLLTHKLCSLKPQQPASACATCTCLKPRHDPASHPLHAEEPAPLQQSGRPAKDVSSPGSHLIVRGSRHHLDVPLAHARGLVAVPQAVEVVRAVWPQAGPALHHPLYLRVQRLPRPFLLQQSESAETGRLEVTQGLNLTILTVPQQPDDDNNLSTAMHAAGAGSGVHSLHVQSVRHSPPGWQLVAMPGCSRLTQPPGERGTWMQEAHAG